MIMIKAQVTKDLDEHVQIIAAVAAMAIMLGISAFVFYAYVTEDKVVEMRQREDERIDALLVDKKGDDADVSASTREQSRDEREIYKSGSVASRIEEAQNDQDIVDFRVKQDELRKKMMCGGRALSRNQLQRATRHRRDVGTVIASGVGLTGLFAHRAERVIHVRCHDRVWTVARATPQKGRRLRRRAPRRLPRALRRRRAARPRPHGPGPCFP